MKIYYFVLLWTISINFIDVICSEHRREKRYLIFTKATQWGVFVTISVPLHPETLVSVAWFFEANYYNVDNATWFEPLLGDVQVSRSKEERSALEPKELLTRRSLYTFIESMLDNHGFPGHPCLLRAICENAVSHFLHNGILGDVLHLILTPSSSMSEDDIQDCYYEAELLGLENQCVYYHYDCPFSPLNFISVDVKNLYL